MCRTSPHSMCFTEKCPLFGRAVSFTSVYHALMHVRITRHPFLKLFSEQDQHRLARALGSLLSPERGSILFGTHVALPSKGILSGRISERDVHMFCHDPMSWKEMWVGQSTDQNSSTLGVDPANNPDGAVFSPDSVTLDTTLVPTKSEAGDHWMWFMVWSITRL